MSPLEMIIVITAPFAVGCLIGSALGFMGGRAEWKWRAEQWRDSAEFWRGFAEQRIGAVEARLREGAST